MSQFFASGGQSIGVSPSNEYSGLISFRMGWLDLLAVQGTLKSLLQHHSSKASVVWCSAFFIIQLSHPYMTSGKTIALTTRTFVDKVMSLFFNMLSRLVIAFLPRSKRLLISWLKYHLQWFWSPKNKVCHCFHYFLTYLPLSEGKFYLLVRCGDTRKGNTNTHFNRKPCLHWNYKSDSPGNRLCTGYLHAGDSGERALGNNPCEGVREEGWGGGEIEWVALQRYPELRLGSGAFVAQYLSIRCVLPQGVGVSLS